ncbi:BMP family protein [Aminobacter sp. P9b]|uniref:BMP family lipoprotein n=1 Tax=unclassified Aminobacter TaxID=2644704 RepID=UPI000D3D918F|nr:BMP family protein [Aminobacter sp. MSH1]AWC24524.1 Purine-binding protein precursor [Aminobacter sp. MSH1]
MIGRLTGRLVASLAMAVLALFALSSVSRAENPDKLRIAVILASGVESGWDGTLIESLERVKAAKPHGLELSWKYTDPLWGDDAGDAMRLFAESGQYDVIWAHSTYSDQVKKLKDEFPEILFVVTGSGNEGLGGNQYMLYKRVHEPAYLLGVIAGRMTKTNVLGTVGTFPADDVNDSINAFFAGARSVNPSIKEKVVFIESWYDPAKSAEYTHAQIATGADVIFQQTDNFKECEAAKIICFGSNQDQSSFSPTTIVSSTVIRWDPDITHVVDAWWQHKVEGKPFAGSTERIWRGMKDGGAGMAPYHGFEATLPQPVISEVEALKAKIISGEFQVPLDVSAPKPN